MAVTFKYCLRSSFYSGVGGFSVLPYLRLGAKLKFGSIECSDSVSLNRLVANLVTRLCWIFLKPANLILCGLLLSFEPRRIMIVLSRGWKSFSSKTPEV